MARATVSNSAFADGAIRQLLPGQHVLVVEDLEAFQFRYGTELPVAGQWQGGLDNSSEQLTLLGDGFMIHQFAYDDSWYPSTDGDGPSLELLNPQQADLDLWGQASSWRASLQSGGSPGTATATRIPGDANGDGRFNSTDLVIVFQAGEYEDGIPQNSTYAEGDWNGDGDFDSSDLVVAFQAGYYRYEAVGAPSLASRSTPGRMGEAELTSHDRFFESLADDDPLLLPVDDLDQLG